MEGLEGRQSAVPCAGLRSDPPSAPSLEMEGGTAFHIVVKEGIDAALDQARAAARGKDVRIGGRAATIRQYLQAGLLDEMHLAISPVLLGQGESLLAGIDLPALGYRVNRLPARHLRN